MSAEQSGEYWYSEPEVEKPSPEAARQELYAAKLALVAAEKRYKAALEAHNNVLCRNNHQTPSQRIAVISTEEYFRLGLHG